MLDLPHWIKYPAKKKNASLQFNAAPVDSGPRKRKEVVDDDGLTEKQFMRMMDKQFDGEAAARDQAKASRRGGPGNTGGTASSSVASTTTTTPAMESDLTDCTFRKLISCTKAVVALKDPATKRKLAEIFLEKPSPEQFPDYYEIIEKPIAINDILRKCRGKLYSTMQEYRDDWTLMVANATQFNGDGSWVVEDGKALVKELERVLKKNGMNEDLASAKPKTPPPKVKKKLRIKLSLKTLKANTKETPATDGDDGEPIPMEEEQQQQVTPSKGKRGRKRKQKR